MTYEGTAAIDGVRGTAAPVGLNFTSAIGAVTGKLLPTGKPLDVIDGIDVSCVDVAMPIDPHARGAIRARPVTKRRTSSTRTKHSSNAWKRSAAKPVC